uniref:Uncharacterized protein n=1 Tax=Romanomermis culicivorax TaxID=13658 RepID=A0A915IKI0_ROMCU
MKNNANLKTVLIGVRQAFKTLSFPVEANHLPLWANLSDKTQLSCKANLYLSGLLQFKTSTKLFSMLKKIKRNERLKIEHGFLGGAVAVPPLANDGIGETIPTRAQQTWPGSGPVDNINPTGGMLYVTTEQNSLRIKAKPLTRQSSECKGDNGAGGLRFGGLMSQILTHPLPPV